MKIALNTTYFSNTIARENSYTIIEVTRGQARRILKLRQETICFMEDKVEGRASLRVPFAGLVWIFTDNGKSIKRLAPLSKGSTFVHLPNDFQIPESCTKAHVESESLSFEHDGNLWLDASTPNYLIKIPVQVFELAVQ